MADFQTALKKVLQFEGGYADDPDDAGGETYRGVSRRFFPRWWGWDYVDALKTDPSFPAVLASDVRLSLAVEMFYEAAFWDRFQGAQIQSQRIADEVMEQAVHLGVHRAVEFLQRGMNLLNRNQQDYSDLAEDGALGPKTLDQVNRQSSSHVWVNYLLVVLNGLQFSHYAERARKSPVNEKYFRGWLSRC